MKGVVIKGINSKPHIKKVRSGWVCLGQGHVTLSSTPCRAYKMWLEATAR